MLHERLALAELTREQEAERRVEQERLRIARDLHDIVAHTLTASTCRPHRSPAARSQPWTCASGPGDDRRRKPRRDRRAQSDPRRAPRPDRLDAPRVPTPGVENVAELAQSARDAGLEIHLEITGTRPERLSEAASLAAYRIMQGSLTNAAATRPERPSASTSRSSPSCSPSRSRTAALLLAPRNYS